MNIVLKPTFNLSDAMPRMLLGEWQENNCVLKSEMLTKFYEQRQMSEGNLSAEEDHGYLAPLLRTSWAAKKYEERSMEEEKIDDEADLQGQKVLNQAKKGREDIRPPQLCDTPISLSSAEAPRGWGRWIGEKRRCPCDDTFPARFLLPSPQPPNCLHGQARKRPPRRREHQYHLRRLPTGAQ